MHLRFKHIAAVIYYKFCLAVSCGVERYNNQNRMEEEKIRRKQSTHGNYAGHDDDGEDDEDEIYVDDEEEPGDALDEDGTGFLSNTFTNPSAMKYTEPTERLKRDTPGEPVKHVHKDTAWAVLGGVPMTKEEFDMGMKLLESRFASSSASRNK